MPAISDQDMNAMLAEESRVCPDFLLDDVNLLSGQFQQFPVK